MMEKENIKDNELNNEEVNDSNNASENINDSSSENTQEGNGTQATEEEVKVEDEEKKEERDPLDVALDEINDLKNQLLYKQAEFENYRKRTLKEKADLILGGGEKTITALLPVIDDFERALADKSDDPKAIKEGMQLIFNKFNKFLEQQGVKKIETKDADFNVDFHEAIAMVPGMGDDKKGKVIDCVQTGYMLNDKVIRHAKVAVGQ